MSATPLHPAGDLAGQTDLHASLPAELQGPGTVITPIAAGMSGAGVYRVDTAAGAFVLKVTAPDEPVEKWRRTVAVQRAAAAADIAPRVMHIDETQRAVLSEHIVDKSFMAQLANPATRATAIAMLGRMLRTLHALPVPATSERANASGFLQGMRAGVSANFIVPAFALQAIDNLLATPFTGTDAPVMSHNDVNPSNLVFDGARLLLLDWQTTAPNTPYYDLGAIAMFLRLDESASRALIAAHDDAPVDEIPAAFTHCRKFAAVLSGTAALHAARARGHAGRDIAIDATPSLGDVYQSLRAGTLDIRTVDGQFTFALALIKEGVLT